MLKRSLSILIVLLLLGSIATYFIVKEVQNLRANRDKAAALLMRQDISVTIVEGKRREEIALQMEKAGVCSASQFMAYSSDMEGYLFPDTYRFFPSTPAKEVVATLYDNYQQKIGPLHPTLQQITLASIIEREAQSDADRGLIAGVFANRLADGMKLESDATVQYAKDSQQIASLPSLNGYIFWQPIKGADTNGINSPYNTYLAPALPPSPIANPGKQSILAAISPAKHQFLYFLYKDGKLLPSKTLAEHTSKI